MNMTPFIANQNRRRSEGHTGTTPELSPEDRRFGMILVAIVIGIAAILLLCMIASLFIAIYGGLLGLGLGTGTSTVLSVLATGGIFGRAFLGLLFVISHSS